MTSILWGGRVYELGVGAKPIPRKKLTAEKLSAAITSVLTKEVQHKAKVLGGNIESENGAYIAAQVITRCLKQR
ncbi:hypothetical protein VB620_19830 [Nodularia harveyana UHCC-0300]|uniref:Uncharacterized protein n=1 Tax=Nodularia harveyana UHCC-0300 TaxID=2974287 RepID=A0ABU5UJC3_9CYAN|nr:hypothetical protein [Nodularia harveyana]MEA5583579.1 hypothetical protein [Nodularia harveyana UHCC-0300]